MQAIGRATLTILLYAILADAAIETFLSAAPGRWMTAGAVGACPTFDMHMLSDPSRVFLH